MVNKPYKKISRKLLVFFILTLSASNPGALHADEYVHMIQYELLFGNKQPVSNLYMSMQHGGMKQSLFSVGNQAVFRTPVISTDPRKFTLLKPVSILFASEDSDNSNENGSDDSAPEPSVGHALGGLVGVVLLLGPLAYAISSSASDVCSDGCGEEVNLPDPSELPDPPPQTGS